jgi:hypothetical protein
MTALVWQLIQELAELGLNTSNEQRNMASIAANHVIRVHYARWASSSLGLSTAENLVLGKRVRGSRSTPPTVKNTSLLVLRCEASVLNSEVGSKPVSIISDATR